MTVLDKVCSQCGDSLPVRVIRTFQWSRLLCQKCAGDAWDRKSGDDVTERHEARKASEVDAALDMVNAPPHYKGKGGMQAIDVIESFELGYCLGNAIKYILRAGKKGEAKEDIEKATWYLRRYVEKL